MIDDEKDGEERHSDDAPIALHDDDLPEADAEEGEVVNEDGVLSLDALGDKEEEEEDALDLAFEEEVDAF